MFRENVSRFLYFVFFINYAGCSSQVLDFKKEVSKWPRKSPMSHLFPLYRKVFLGRAIFSSEPKIEKIIHQIWLGSPVPERYKKAMGSWKIIHPDWEYRLWTDEDVEGFKLVNKKHFDQAQNYGIKSDLFRMEILYRLGGLYVDCDQYCIKSHCIFHHCCELYFGNFEQKDLSPCFTNCLIGAKKHNGFLLELINGINKSQKDSRKIKNPFFYTLEFSGPRYLTRMTNKHLVDSDTFLALDKGFFAPVEYMQDMWGDCLDALDLSTYRKYYKPYTYSVQFYTSSWGKP